MTILSFCSFVFLFSILASFVFELMKESVSEYFYFFILCLILSSPLIATLLSNINIGHGEVVGVLISKSEDGLLIKTGSVEVKSDEAASSSIKLCMAPHKMKLLETGDYYAFTYYKPLVYMPFVACGGRGVVDMGKEFYYDNK